MPYIGRAATNAGSVNYLDDISSGFDGNDVTFTCAVKGTTITPGQENVYIYLDGVFQHPGESYTISGSTITFTEAPVSGVDFTAYVAGEGAYLDDGTVSTAKLDDDAVTASKLDDDGTGFQVGDLGVGGSLTSGDKLTVTGRLRASGGIIGDVTGDLTGDVTGNLTGNVTGNLTGNVTGNTSGTAATVTGASQTNITSVGTLSSLTTSGKVGINGAIDSSYAGATIHGTTALKTTPSDGSELRFKLYTGGAADASILQMFKADGSTIGVNLHSNGESYFKNSSHSVLALEAGTNSSASLRLRNDAQHWDVNCQTNDNFAVYDHTGGAAAFTIESGGYNASFTGTIQSIQSQSGDYANVAFLTSQSGNGGVKISHGGGNGKLELYGGNQSRTQFYANQITANVNGLEIKTTDAQSLVFGTDNTTRMTIDSNGRAEFKKLVYRVNTEQQQQTNLMSCFHWDHPGTDSVSFFDFNPVLDLGLRQEGGSFFLKISGWPLDRFFGLITYRNNGGSGNINSGSHSMDTIVNDGFSVTVTRPSGNLIRIQLTGHHNNNHAWDMMAFSAPFVT